MDAIEVTCCLCLVFTKLFLQIIRIPSIRGAFGVVIWFVAILDCVLIALDVFMTGKTRIMNCTACHKCWSRCYGKGLFKILFIFVYLTILINLWALILFLFFWTFKGLINDLCVDPSVLSSDFVFEISTFRLGADITWSQVKPYCEEFENGISFRNCFIGSLMCLLAQTNLLSVMSANYALSKSGVSSPLSSTDQLENIDNFKGFVNDEQAPRSTIAAPIVPSSSAGGGSRQMQMQPQHHPHKGDSDLAEPLLDRNSFVEQFSNDNEAYPRSSTGPARILPDGSAGIIRNITQRTDSGSVNARGNLDDAQKVPSRVPTVDTVVMEANDSTSPRTVHLCG
jgi:hypothetical protein